MDVKALVKLAGVTRGRVLPRTVFQDFVAFAALAISNSFDPIHRTQRMEAINMLCKEYTQQEQEQFAAGFHAFVEQCQKNIELGRFEDLLGQAYLGLGLGGRDGQDFSPRCIGELIAEISANAGMGDAILPEQGYFTIMDPACGSGILSLTTAEHLMCLGFNPCEHLVIQANDVALRCVHMAYVQMSCYGIPAVVIHGDTLTLKEHSRWYTPAYLLENWVWRCPMPFTPGRNLTDERLKMAQDPMYLAIRRITWPELFTASSKECATAEP